MNDKLIFELSSEGRIGYTLPELDVPEKDISTLIDSKYLRKDDARLPEVAEGDVVRHFVNLSRKNYHVDQNIYPLGSCTMKYNPKINEDMAALPGFSTIHPFQPEETIQGAMEMLYDLEIMLLDITGMNAITLQPAAGSHGELTGLMLIRKALEKRGDARKTILMPDSAHGTNPASVTISGYKTVQIKSNSEGKVDLESLKENLNEDVAGLMITNPNTLGIFETDIIKINEMVHEAGGLVYMDGANMNALTGMIRPGDLGFDIVHLNLHKTFSTPHGGGGPGSGPIAVCEEIADYLPVPVVVKNNNTYSWEWNKPDSIGKVSPFYGNFAILVRAYVYIKMLGSEGLKRVSENSLINANYLLKRLQEYYDVPYPGPVMHECVLSGTRQKEKGVKVTDIAKRLLDLGFHAPTTYFPLIVKEALMIEPPETESKESVDSLIEALIQIAKEVDEDPEMLHEAPVNTPVRRMDEVKANRELNLNYFK